MKWIAMAALVAVSACSSSRSHELAETSKSDPIWQLNEGKWNFNENALVTPSVVVP